MSDELHDGCGCHEYNELSRRQFIGAAAAASATAFFPAWVPKIKLAATYASNRDVIVSIFMRGAADGLAIVAPFGDSTYYTARPTIGIPRPDDTTRLASERGINLDGFFAFANAMQGLVPAFAAKDLLITHGTGIQTNNSRSHFDAQRYVEVGKPADPTLITGWLGRHLALTANSPIKAGSVLRGIGISNGLQKTLQGAPQTLPIADPTNYTIGGSSTTQAARMAFMQSDYTAADDSLLKSSALDAVNTVSLLKLVNFAGYKTANSAVYPTSSFGRALRSVAVLIKSDVGVEAAQLDIGGWDTHSAQGATNGGMRNLMQDFSNSLGAFYADVIAAGYNVTVVAISEFGRNVRENASLGTDHGRGSVSFSMGKGINGGRVLLGTPWKSLDRANLEAGQDLPVTIDYRDVLAEIVQNRLANPSLDLVFPGWTPHTLGVTR